MRGIAHQPEIPLFADRYLLKPACLAVYPMYKGLAQLVGMKKIEGPQTIAEQFERYLAAVAAAVVRAIEKPARQNDGLHREKEFSVDAR